MQVNWRLINAARNSYAALFAACELSGFRLNPAERPESEVTCYSLTSITEPLFRDEIAGADCITVVGGPHATACPLEVARYADFVVAGEGEYTLPALLARIEAGQSGPIPGVATREGYIPSDHCVRLDMFPSFSQMKGYVEITRGCPFSCAFCQTPQIFGHGMRHRSIDAICSFAGRYIHARFVSPNALAYGSDGVHARYEKVERLLKRLKAIGNQIFLGTFPSEVRPEFICRTSLDLINRYCTNTKIHFGAQSGSDVILKKIHRGHTVDDVMQAVELSREYGLTPVVDFILGFPFETEDDERATVDLISRVTRDGIVHAHRFISLPGTPLAGTRARPLMPETEKVLGSLALLGKLTGSWSAPEIRFFRHPSNDIA
jgi:B12-binding domain/radical SAM domain protein